MRSSRVLGGNTISDADPLPVDAAGIAPPIDWVAVTKSDATADPNGPFRAIIIGGAGIVKVTMDSGETRTIPATVLAAQTVYEMRFTRVWDATTTATDIWGLV